MKKFCAFLILAVTFASFLNAVQVIPQSDPWGAAGNSFGTGFSGGMIQAQQQARQIEQDRQARELQEKLIQKMAEVERYHNTVNQLSCTPTHPTLRLSEQETSCVTGSGPINFSGKWKVDYVFKYKLDRVLSDGSQVEWVWSLDLSNQTLRGFLSSGRIDLPSARIELCLVDTNGFALSTCVVYSDIGLKRKEQTTLQGKWVIPYDQISKISGYKFRIN